ncbi:hypothetical protein T492DRAFT_843011 [Pavlovales sp. CCMP2436]|nr:hypothetical protein T492DRAFT_843011 [Pavlovales sp. CCMP2436]
MLIPPPKQSSTAFGQDPYLQYFSGQYSEFIYAGRIWEEYAGRTKCTHSKSSIEDITKEFEEDDERTRQFAEELMASMAESFRCLYFIMIDFIVSYFIIMYTREGGGGLRRLRKMRHCSNSPIDEFMLI